MTLEGVGFVPVKYQIAFTFIMDPVMNDLNGSLEEFDQADKVATLLGWANDGACWPWIACSRWCPTGACSWTPCRCPHAPHSHRIVRALHRKLTLVQV